ncbi:MAG: putative endonuclease [Thermoleophilaceae bacterium]|nr:putative endonuclease [Thermoleophilaceae bacterium]
MSPHTRQRRGSLGEQIAVDHLEARGFEIVQRNYRTRFGELDIVAADERALVFCEVKTRVANGRTGPAGPLDAIGAQKRQRIRRMAAQWLAESGAERPARADLRFDAIGIVIEPDGRLVALEHREGAF